MAAAIRENIIAALKTALATITTDNGYRTDVHTVETQARDWAELTDDEANATDGAWLGIVPQTEVYRDRQGVVDSTWTITILAHVRTSAKTEATALTAVSDLATDIRRLLYNTQSATLGVSGVHFVRLASRSDSLGAPEALFEQWATTAYQVEVVFEETVSLT